MTNRDWIAATFSFSVAFGSIGFIIGLNVDRPAACPEPQYDVNRVVKMHEEARQCAVELEEARDNVLVCGRLLKRALE